MINQCKPPHVVWIYEKSHWKHPFIRMQLDYLVDAGFKVTHINMLSSGLKGTRYRHISIIKRGRPLKPLLDRQYGATRFGVSLPALMFALAMKERPDVVLTSLPVGLIVGWMIKALIGSRLVYYPFELYGEQLSLFSRGLKWLEKQALQYGVDALITQNDRRAAVYSQERGCRVSPTIVHNYKPFRKVSPAGKLRELAGLAPDAKIVLYEGRLIPGRWIENLIEASAHFCDHSKLVLLGKADESAGWWKNTILPLISHPNIKNKVALGKWVPPDKIMDYVADADAGIIIYDDATRNNYYCEPGKLSDYVVAGVPVVAPRFPSIGPVIERYRIGTTFGSPEPKCIAEAVNRILRSPKEIYKAHLERAARELVWETQAEHFLNAVSGRVVNFN